jgi:hypothetical protein
MATSKNSIFLSLKWFIYKIFTISLVLTLTPFACWSQANFENHGTPIVVNLQKDFGANPNDNLDDTWAFIKASKYLENSWDKNGIPYPAGQKNANINYANHYAVLQIPASINGGSYLVGKQQILYKKIIGGKMYTVADKFSGGDPPPQIVPYKYIFDASNSSTTVNPANNEGLYLYMGLCRKPGATPEWNMPYAISTDIFAMEGLNKNIDGIKIEGFLHKGKKPKIRYADGLMVGNALSDGSLADDPSGNEFSWGRMYLNGGNTCFQFKNINNVQLSNIEIDGNNSHVVFKGKTYDNFQLGGTAIFFGENSSNYTLQNLYVHHNVIDGVSVKTWESSVPKKVENIFFNNVVSEYNGRCGLALAAGKNVLIKNSKFNFSGKAQHDPKYGGRISSLGDGVGIGSAPMCGVDIEAEGGTFIRDINFVNCEFIDHGHTSVVNDLEMAYANNASDVTFSKCTFWNRVTAIWCRGNNFVFDSCGIYGMVTHMGHGYKSGSNTKFNNCIFEDKPNPYNKKDFWDEKTRLITSDNQARSTLFNKCKFVVNSSTRKMFWIKGASQSNDSLLHFRDCNFEFKSQMPATDLSAGSIIMHAKFSGNTNLYNTNKSKMSYTHWLVFGCIIEGSKQASTPSIFTIKGNMKLEIQDRADCFLRIGQTPKENNCNSYASLVVDSNALLFFQQGNSLADNFIGKNSNLIIKPYGSFLTYRGGTNIGLFGKFMVDRNAYFCATAAQFLKNKNGTADPNILYIDPKATLGINPYWNNIDQSMACSDALSGFGSGTNPIVSIYGSNKLVPIKYHSPNTIKIK